MEHDMIATVDGLPIGVAVSYELDGMDPIIYGIFSLVDDSDVTEGVTEEEYERIHATVRMKEVQGMYESAEYAAER